MRPLLAAFVLFLAVPPSLVAQVPSPIALPRGDAHGFVAWDNLHEPNGLSSNDWINSVLLFGGAGGWYVTEHLRLHGDAGITTEGTQYRASVIDSHGQQTFVSSRLRLSQRNIALGAQYQFLHNAWFHPHAGVGALVTVEKRTEAFDPAYGYDPLTGTYRPIVPQHTIGPEQRSFVRPFADVGFKAYWSSRAFVIHDTRLVASGHGLDQVSFTFGLGVDFP